MNNPVIRKRKGLLFPIRAKTFSIRGKSGSWDFSKSHYGCENSLLTKVVTAIRLCCCLTAVLYQSSIIPMLHGMDM